MKITLTLLTAVLFSSAAAGQSTWIVDLQGGGDFTSIQEAVSDAGVVDGDTVLVLPGTYLENIDYGGKNIVLRSAQGPAVTVIDGQALDSVVSFWGGETQAAVLDGFTITNGRAWDGGGVRIISTAEGLASSATILNCVIQGNVGTGGGGGMIVASGPTLVRNCLIQGNSTDLYNGGGVVLFNTGVSVRFERCTLRENTSAGAGGGIFCWNEVAADIVDCVIAENLPGNIHGYQGAFQGQYSLCQGSSGEAWFGQGCIDADPLFADDGMGLAPLSALAAGQAADSPAIDAGDPASIPSGTTRSDGVHDCGRLDMGYHAPTTCECITSNYCVSAGNSAGTVCTIGWQGTHSITSNDFTLTASGAPPLKFGLFFYGAAQTQIILGEGMLCIAPPIQRLQPILVTDAQGAASLSIDFTQEPVSSGPFAMTPFSTWNFQFWHRDPFGGPAGFNFSDGLEVTICP